MKVNNMSYIKRCWQYVGTWSLISRLAMFFSLFALLIWTLAMGTAWRFDNQHIRIFYDSHMQLLAKSLAELDFEKMHGEIDEIDEILPDKRKKKFESVNEKFSFAVFTQEGQLILSDDDDGKYLPFFQERGYRILDRDSDDVRKNFGRNRPYNDDDDDELDGDKWRLYGLPVQKGRYMVVVGQNLEHREDVVLKILWRHMIPWLVILPIFILGLIWILRQELKPLRSLTQNLRTRDAHDVHPVEIPVLTTETRPLVQALNVLLERIQSLLQQERAFVSNAAHELRTPLAGLHVQAEVLEMCMDDAAARENAVKKILEGTTRCSRLVEQLLLLSSLEAKTVARNQETIPWHILVQDAQDTVQWAADAKQVTLQAHMQGEPKLKEGYGELWGIALRNLLDNAVRYSVLEGKVQLSLQAEKLVVENYAPHVPQEALAQLGQRFYRLPGQKEKGSGLGLAIVGHIAALHRARVLVENSVLDGQHSVRVTVLF